MKSKKSIAPLIFGLIVICIGLQSFVGQFGIVLPTFSYFVTTLIGGGVALVLSLILFFNRSRFWSFVFLFGGIGAIISGFVTTMSQGEVHFGYIGTAFILGFGAYLLSKYFEKEKVPTYDYTNQNGENNPRSNQFTSSFDRIQVNDSFSSNTQYVQAPNFTGGIISSRFSNSVVYLTQSTLASTGAQIDVDVKCGHLEIHVPNYWNVDTSNLRTAMGDISYRGMATMSNMNVALVLRGDVSLGNIEIFYE